VAKKTDGATPFVPSDCKLVLNLALQPLGLPIAHARLSSCTITPATAVALRPSHKKPRTRND
jgi:hypothetical protein